MSATSRVAGAVAAGYLLGRFKKLRLAVLVGTAMASPKFRNAAVGLIQDRIPGGAVVGTLGKDVGGRLLDAGKAAATSVLASRIDGFSESLAHRSENLRKSTNGHANKSRTEDVEDKQSAEAPDDEAYEDEENELAEEPEDEYEEDSDAAEEPQDEYEDEETELAEEPEDEYEEDSDAAEEPQDEYEDEETDEAKEPEDEHEEDTDVAEEPEAKGRQADYDGEDDDSPDEEPEEEPVARSARRRRSASPAGRRRG